MDWYAWLCRAGLHPDVAFDYALLFARNELGAADVRHLDHDFLLSMGVAVAKHRLDILKLARKDPSSSSSVAAAAVLPWRATRLLAAAVHRSARTALGRLRATVSRGRGRDLEYRADRVAAVLAAAPPHLPLLRHRGGRVAHSTWSKIVASPVAVRGGKLPVPVPMLTHVVVGKPVVLTDSRADRWSGNDGAAVRKLPAPAPAGSIAASCLVGTDDDEDEVEVSDEEVEVVVVDGGEEEMRWESMFQDLKPT